MMTEILAGIGVITVLATIFQGLRLLFSYPVVIEPERPWRPRVECECDDCMEPGLRGPGRTSLD